MSVCACVGGALGVTAAQGQPLKPAIRLTGRFPSEAAHTGPMHRQRPGRTPLGTSAAPRPAYCPGRRGGQSRATSWLCFALRLGTRGQAYPGNSRSPSTPGRGISLTRRALPPCRAHEVHKQGAHPICHCRLPGTHRQAALSPRAASLRQGACKIAPGSTSQRSFSHLRTAMHPLGVDTEARSTPPGRARGPSF